MARLHLVALAATLLLASVSEAAGGRQVLADVSVAPAPSSMVAGAPGPSAGKPPADILFTISAARAVLATDTLTLTGVAPVALHTTAGQGIGTTAVEAFANSTAGAAFVDTAGQWLADPVAVLVGTANGTSTKALVKLASPQLSANKTTLTFQVTILPADSAALLPTAGGATARLVDDKANGLADNLLTAAPDAPLSDAALFIDASSQSIAPQAQAKTFGPGWGWGGPWRRGWGDGYYDRPYWGKK